ncbi:MAG: valine--tRNA ligase [Chloroflexota bacterium]
MTKSEMPSTYDPHSTETRLYPWWESQGYFKPRINPERKPFVISMPPPNVTGALHLGHAMTASLEDLMIRYHRMKGDPTLWLPGTDHAGIATQNVVERELAKEGLTRHDLGREAFIQKCWEWKEKSHQRITDQHRRLGVSCDWDRERFTLDEGLSHAVRVAFVRMFQKGLIYRGSYLVNWCPRCESAISDLEVIHQDHAAHLWYVRYPLLGDGWSGPAAPWGSGRWAEGATQFIELATTRPETILGDSAVAVHPTASRFSRLAGRTAMLPAMNRAIPIIADEVVDPAFGTGAVKVTPAHDATDYEMGQRHNLEQIDVMTDTGLMNAAAGPYAGQDRYECRRNLVADLEKEGLLIQIENYQHALGHCQRCDTVVEPRISTQWFVRTQPLAGPAIEAVRDGRIQIVPERFSKVYFNWLENIRDWCISRQLWWGHRIPVWYCADCNELTVSVDDPTACAACGSQHIHQDEDVLDTWFSSGLWPFSTLGWPEETDDLQTFYPTSVLETGYDILFFWVARMIMQGLEMTGQSPFDTVYLHGLIRNETGAKISKSLPDAEKYDPLHIIDEYGTDALRFTLLTGSTPGNDMKLSLSRIEANRNFANKVWNAARFVINSLDEIAPATGAATWNLAQRTLADRWISSRLNRLIQNVTHLMDSYQFGEAGRQIYDFMWGEYCDWFIEIAKIRLYGRDPRARQTAQQVLIHVLEQTLRLLHPFMPFVTEEIWQHLPLADEPSLADSLMVMPWPEAGELDPDAEAHMTLLMESIRAIRNARAEYEVTPGREIAATLAAGPHYELFDSQRDILTRLARIDTRRFNVVGSLPIKPEKAIALVVSNVEIYLPLADMVDLDAERARLGKELDEVKGQLTRSQELLTNENFCRKAPAQVVERERDKLTALQERAAKLAERLKSLA